MKKEHATALFEMAGFDVKSIHELPNGYWPKHPDYDDVRSPWWLIETQHGLIKIGWRKRVISICWEATSFRDAEHEVTQKEVNVTACVDLCHAWSYPKALEYLGRLRTLIQRASVQAPADDV